ncbi:MAG: periplasmic heavy metal sensor [Thermodesulfobacteriota bacterium]|jgi:Spy/CpxP family protein refolding chaperone
MKKPIIALGLVMVMLFGVSYVYAQEQGDPPRHGWMHGEKSWGQEKRLNLTQEQKVRFKKLCRKFMEENAQLIGGFVTKRLELKLLWTDPEADSQAIQTKEKELRDLQNQLRDKIVRYILEARNCLTPEQIEELGSMDGMGLGFGRRFIMGYGQGIDRPGAMGHGWEMSGSEMWQ